MLTSALRFAGSFVTVVLVVALVTSCSSEGDRLWNARGMRIRDQAAAKVAVAKAAAAAAKLLAAEKAKKDSEGGKGPMLDVTEDVVSGLKAMLEARNKFEPDQEEAEIEKMLTLDRGLMLKVLLELLNSNKNGLGAPAARVIGRTKDITYIRPLIRALKGSDLFVAEAAAGALGDLGSDAAILQLVTAVSEKGRVPVRVAIIGALARIGNKGAVPTLLESLTDPAIEIKRAGAVALGILGDERGKGPLLSLLAETEDPTTRIDLGLALMKLNDPKGLPTVAGMLVSGSKEARQQAFDILKKHGDRDAALMGILDVFDDEPPHRLSLIDHLVQLCDVACKTDVVKRSKVAKNDPHINAYKLLMQKIKEKLGE